MSDQSNRNLLDRKEQFRLASWLHVNREMLMGKKLAYSETAPLAEKELGFKVSPANVRSVAEACGVEWERRMPPRPSKQAVLAGRVGDLEFANKQCVELLHAAEERVRQAEANCAQLRMLVYHLYQELGCKPPPGVTIPRPNSTVNVSGK